VVAWWTFPCEESPGKETPFILLPKYYLASVRLGEPVDSIPESLFDKYSRTIFHQERDLQIR
jgi:hypothetical protein